MSDLELSRKHFEEWISKSPYERDVSRFPSDPDKTSWPGSYKDIYTQLAWDAWCEARLYALE